MQDQEQTETEKALATFAETFEGQQFRAQLHNGVLHYCIVDIMAIVSLSPQPRVYWAQRRKSLMSDEGLDEGFKKSIIKLKLVSPADGKLYPMDCCPRQTLLRILMTVPSPKAEPFKLRGICHILLSLTTSICHSEDRTRTVCKGIKRVA